jgi:hypothetical protein
MALGRAFSKNGHKVNDKFVNKLRSISFQGASGLISFDRNGDLKKGLPIVIQQVVNGTLAPF